MGKMLIMPTAMIATFWAFGGISLAMNLGFLDYPTWYESIALMLLGLIIGYLHVKKGMFHGDYFKASWEK